MAPVFSLPRNDQIGSPLTRLPAELRLMILRLLLKTAEPVYGRTAVQYRRAEYVLQEDIRVSRSGHVSQRRPHAVWKTYTRRTRFFQPSIIASCQQLYSEGFSILYSENISRVHVTGAGVRMLDHYQYCGTYEHVSVSNIEWYPLKQATRVLLDVHNYRYISPENFTDAFRCLSNAPRRKFVNVVFQVPDAIAQSPQSLAAFRLLRCESIKFSGIDKLLWQGTADIVESKEVIRDPLKLYDQVHAYYHRHSSRLRLELSDDMENVLRRLRIAAQCFDSKTFESERERIFAMMQRLLLDETRTLRADDPNTWALSRVR